MTAIIGLRGVGIVTLAADTRRRDQVTGQLKQVRKVHQWSSELIFAQGGAGTGAADEVVRRLFAERADIGDDMLSVIEFLKTHSSDIIAPALERWRQAGKTMPPTYLVFGAVDSQTRNGIHVSFDLVAGQLLLTLDTPGPYFTGISTNLIQQIATEVYFEFNSENSSVLSFDAYALEVVSRVSNAFPNDVSLPIDIGFVRCERAGRIEAGLKVDISVLPESDPRLLVHI